MSCKTKLLSVVCFVVSFCLVSVSFAQSRVGVEAPQSGVAGSSYTSPYSQPYAQPLKASVTELPFPGFQPTKKGCEKPPTPKGIDYVLTLVCVSSFDVQTGQTKEECEYKWVPNPRMHPITGQVIPMEPYPADCDKPVPLPVVGQSGCLKFIEKPWDFCTCVANSDTRPKGLSADVLLAQCCKGIGGELINSFAGQQCIAKDKKVEKAAEEF